MSARVKICGLKTADAVADAVAAGAGFLGFNFFGKSPRFVTMAQARRLTQEVPAGVAKVGLIVNESDAFIKTLLREVPLDILQLHGSETPERVAEIKELTGLPVIKAIGIAGPEDVPQIDLYAGAADMLLIDAKAPRGADLPGGNGITFDWRLVQRKYWSLPWMLAGGLTPDNVAEAARLTGAQVVDVASGVESAPGVKDAAMMRAFVQAVA